jgi:hypothetical protein
LLLCSSDFYFIPQPSEKAMRKSKRALSGGAILYMAMALTAPAIGQGQADGSAQKQDKAAPSTGQTAPTTNTQTQSSGLPASAPIKGFHPIKRAMQPVENLEGLGIKLEQQIMKLEGPIAALKPPMINLQSQMTVVDDSMTKMEKRVCGVHDQMGGVRSDLAKMQGDITELKKPILAIQQPLSTIAAPLEGVKRQLSLVVLAIYAMAIGIVFGTPLAAVITYKYRHKLFPSKVTATLPGERELAATGSQ